jgi:hypothetical protein
MRGRLSPASWARSSTRAGNLTAICSARTGGCTAPHWRELIDLFEALEQVWAGRMIELRGACPEANEAGGSLALARLAHFRGR